MAKKFHPDKNPGGEKAAERKFRQIITAYEVLSDHESRNTYDRKLEFSCASARGNCVKNLRRKARNDTAYLCQLILFELLSQNVQTALELYEGLISKEPHLNLDRYMSDSDTKDCEFLLAEAYHLRGELSEAARLYEKVLEREEKKAYFRNFAEEIRLMLRDVYLQYIGKTSCPEEIVANMEKLLAMAPSKRDIARIYKKVAEAYYRAHDIESAMRTLRQAFQINPRLTGAKKISRKLGIEPRL